MKENKTTLEEIAKKLGISKMTVSRAINHPEKVGGKTLQKVNKALKETDYKPKFIARVLAGSESKTIGFFVKPNRDFIIPPFYGECVKGATQWLRSLDYSTLIFNATEERSKVLLMDYVNSGLIDGAVVFEGSYDETLLRTLNNNQIPAVSVGEENVGEYDIPTVSSDNYSGSVKAVDYLVKCNCKNIVHITGHGEKPSYQQRMKGYCDVLNKNGMTSHIVKTENTVEGGIEGIRHLVNEQIPFDGVFCFSDLVAWGVLKECSKKGIQVPSEVCVMGFDNIPLSQYTTPSLSTVSQNMLEMSRYAAGMLIQIISGKKPDNRHRRFETELILRNSTKCQ
ncbi:MAG: LacI family DNA-binding transcriptional regulator [Thermotogota bacterium]|nr:LacI family DNA-binding transcriptional regulator [Thermotogota bacterium]